MTNGNQLTREEQAWLVEYQVCQQDANSTSSNYWTLAGIFIGVSSVLLGWLLYGMLANAVNTYAFRTIITVVGVSMMMVLVFLWFWLKRVNYLADRYYDRMHEIEIKLGMHKNFRISAIDEWTRLGFKSADKLSEKEINKRWNKLKPELLKRLASEYDVELDKLKQDLVEYCNRCPRQRWYERPSRNLHYRAIFSILIGLWSFAILIAWFYLIIASISSLFIALIAFFMPSLVKLARRE